MGSLKFPLIFFVVFIISFTSPSISQDSEVGPDEVSNPGLSIPSPSSQTSDEPHDDGVSSSPPNGPINNDPASPRGGSSGHSSGSSTSNSVFFFKDEVYIKPLEYPIKAVSDRSDNIRKVQMEIISNNEKDAELDIREYIDKNLSIILPSLHGYVLTTPDEFSLYKSGILEKLESNEDIEIREHNNRIYFDLGDYTNYSIGKSNIYEVNNLPTTLPYSGHSDAILYWNKSLNNSGLSCLLQPYLLVNNLRNYSEAISCACDRINISTDDGMVFLNRSSSKMDENSLILHHGDIIAHLKCNASKEKGNSSPVCVYDVMDMLTFDNVTIPSGSLFVYWYYVVPRSYGTFHTETVTFTKINGLKEFSQNELDIENQPVFRVEPKISKSCEYVNEILGLEYDIEYMGGGPQSSSGNISIAFDEDPNYILVNEKGKETTGNALMDFKMDTSESIKIYIKYKQKGEFSLPGIWINKRHYTFNRYVTIDDPLSRNPTLAGNIFAGIVALFLFILTLIFKDIILYDQRDKRKWKRRIEKFWTKQRLLLSILVILIIWIIGKYIYGYLY
jgi:hypothetical protein